MQHLEIYLLWKWRISTAMFNFIRGCRNMLEAITLPETNSEFIAEYVVVRKTSLSFWGQLGLFSVFSCLGRIFDAYNHSYQKLNMSTWYHVSNHQALLSFVFFCRPRNSLIKNRTAFILRSTWIWCEVVSRWRATCVYGTRCPGRKFRFDRVVRTGVIKWDPLGGSSQDL